MRPHLVIAALILMAGPLPAAFGQEGLLPGSKSLSKTLRTLEQKKIRPVKVSIDQRQWIVEGFDRKESVRLRVDPRTGQIKSREKIPDLDPVEGSLPLSRIIHKLEEANPGPIVRVHYSRKSWVIETRRGKTTTEIQLSAATGELLKGRDEN